MYGGLHSNVWFDRRILELEAAEDTATMDAMCDNIDALIQLEVNKGIPRSRILLGEFSLAFNLGLN